MVSIIIPVIHEKKAANCLDAIDNNAPSDGYLRTVDSALGLVEFEIVSEVDYDRIGCPKMVKRLVDRARGDMVLFLGDDTLPQPDFLKHALDEMAQFQGCWGLVGLNDGYNGPSLPTHWLASKRLLPYIGGEFFHTGYFHTHCDKELHARAVEIGRYRWAEKARIIHDHPLVNREAMDLDEYPGYIKENYLHDLILFRRRQRNGWENV